MSASPKPAGSEPYIVVMANQADRANRPTIFILLACVIIFAGIVYALFGIRSYVEGNAALQRQLTEQIGVNRRLSEIDRLNERNPDLLRLYPPGELLMPIHLRNAANTAFSDNESSDTLPSDFTVREVTTRPLESSPSLNVNTVQVTIAGAKQLPLEDIFLFIETALRDEPSGMMFLREIHLSPTPRGWSVTSIEFQRYSFNRNRPNR